MLIRFIHILGQFCYIYIEVQHYITRRRGRKCAWTVECQSWVYLTEFMLLLCKQFPGFSCLKIRNTIVSDILETRLLLKIWAKLYPSFFTVEVELWFYIHIPTLTVKQTYFFIGVCSMWYVWSLSTWRRPYNIEECHNMLSCIVLVWLLRTYIRYMLVDNMGIYDARY